MLFPIALIIITQIVIPIFFLVWLWRGRDRSKLDWFLKLLIVALFYIHIFLTGRWDWLSYYLRFVLVILFAIAAYQSFTKAKHLPFYPPRKLGNHVSLGINAAVILLLLTILSSYIPRGYLFSGESIQLAFPLKNGIYYIGQGGNSPTLNYHNVNPTQRYALDIMKLNAAGTRANGLYPQSLTNYAIFGEPVYSPCNGTVRETRNNLPELTLMQRDTKNLAGNHVLIQCDGADVLLAHLQRGSVTVTEEEAIQIGQAIAKVGNSGNTSEPRLHIHARKENTGSSLLDGEAMPITFFDQFLVRNSLFISD